MSSSIINSIKKEINDYACTSCIDLKKTLKVTQSENEDLKREISVLKKQNNILKELNKSNDEQIRLYESKISNYKTDVNIKNTRFNKSLISIDSGNDEQETICLDSSDQEDSAVVLKNAHHVRISRESEQLRPAKKLKLNSSREKNTTANFSAKTSSKRKLTNELTKKDPSDSYFEGLELTKNKKYSKAIEKFDEAIKVDSKNSDFLFDKAECYKEWAESLTKEESNREIYFNSAVSTYDKVLKLDNNHHRAYNSRAICVCYLGKLDEALVGYQKAIEIQPNNPNYYYNRGMTYWEHKQLNSALKSVELSIDVHFRIRSKNEKFKKKDLADVYFNKGKLLKELNRLVEAKEAYEEANKLQKCNEYLNAIGATEKLIKKSGNSD